MVIVHDTERDSRLQLYEVECLIAKQMDGTRDLDAIARAAKPHVPWATRGHIEKLAVQIAGMGLLSNVAPPRYATSQALDAKTPDPASEQLDGESLFYDRTTLEPNGAAMFGDDPNGVDMLDAATALQTPGSLGFEDEESPVIASTRPLGSQPMAIGSRIVRGSARQPIAARVAQARASAPRMEATEPPLAPAFAPTLAHDAAEPVDPVELDPALTEPPPEPSFPPPPPEPAADARQMKEAEPWVVEKPRIYKRRWFRRLLWLAIPALIIGILGVIPYPLYVTESCLVQPSKLAHVRAPIDGIIAEIFVGEGDQIAAGAPLVRLDDREISFELQKAEAELQRLRINLDKQRTGSRPEEVKKAEAHVRTAANDVYFAGKTLKRAQDLLKNGVGSLQERDEAAREVSLKQSLYGEAEAQLKLIRAGSRPEEVAIAEAEVKRAEADVEHFQRYKDRLVIKAPIAGRVLTPRFRERIHEKLREGDLVAELGDMSTVRVEIDVPEREADVVAVGQPVTVKVHSLPLQGFTGEVKFIAPAVGETKEGGRILRVDAQVANDQGLLQAGMTGYAEINTGERTVLSRLTRRVVRWIRVRFLL